MANQGRWTEDRFGRQDGERWREGAHRRESGDFERFDPDSERYGGEYGAAHGDYGSGHPWRPHPGYFGPVPGFGRAYPDWRGYGRHYGEPYRGPGWQRGSANAPRRDYGEHERGWWDRASDEVSSWFGDEDAERRRQMDSVRPNLRGRGPKGYVRSDERICEDVCDRLSDDPFVDASDVEVVVAGSEVTLTGTVSSRQERRRAEDCAELVSGVGHVQNNLRVVHGAGQSGQGAAARKAEKPGSASSAGRTN